MVIVIATRCYVNTDRKKVLVLKLRLTDKCMALPLLCSVGAVRMKRAGGGSRDPEELDSVGPWQLLRC